MTVLAGRHGTDTLLGRLSGSGRVNWPEFHFGGVLERSLEVTQLSLIVIDHQVKQRLRSRDKVFNMLTSWVRQARETVWGLETVPITSKA